MSHPLDDARIKIARAGEHIEALGEETRVFARHNGYEFGFDYDSKTQSATISVRSRRVPPLDPPPYLGVLVGDALYNLRSALNHLVWQLAILDGGADPPVPDTVQFPVFDTRKQFKESRKRYLGPINETHCAQIRRLQPYHRTHAGRMLAGLVHLDNISKHKVIHSGWSYMPTGEGSLNSTGIVTAQVTSADWKRIEHGTVLYRVTDIVPSGDSDVSMKPTSAYAIVFGESITVGLGDLFVFRDVVHNVVESFAPDFPI